MRNPFFVSQIKNVPGGMECVPRRPFLVAEHRAYPREFFAALRLIKRATVSAFSIPLALTIPLCLSLTHQVVDVVGLCALQRPGLARVQPP